ncbi:unnamed protein product [Rhizophagus irregularis]|nr:unnamed protein product [Rhizophagus irregularis]
MFDSAFAIRCEVSARLSGWGLLEMVSFATGCETRESLLNVSHLLFFSRFNFPGHETLDTVWIFWLFLAWILEIDSHQDFNFPERETLETVSFVKRNLTLFY